MSAVETKVFAVETIVSAVETKVSTEETKVSTDETKVSTEETKVSKAEIIWNFSFTKNICWNFLPIEAFPVWIENRFFVDPVLFKELFDEILMFGQ